MPDQQTGTAADTAQRAEQQRQAQEWRERQDAQQRARDAYLTSRLSNNGT